MIISLSIQKFCTSACGIAADLPRFDCMVIQLEDNDVLHMVMGDYAIFNMAQPDREQAVERVHQVPAAGTRPPFDNPKLHRWHS